MARIFAEMPCHFDSCQNVKIDVRTDELLTSAGVLLLTTLVFSETFLFLNYFGHFIFSWTIKVFQI